MAFAVAARLSMAVVVVIAVFAVTIRSGEPNPGKDSKCFNPTIHACNTSIYPILRYKLSAWFYHSLFRSCRPLYSENGVHDCSVNKNLPATREECERLCGVSCTSGDGRTGICTFDEYCKSNAKRTADYPWPCGAYGVICCPPVTDAPQDADVLVPSPQLSTTAGPSTASTVSKKVDADNNERYSSGSVPAAPTRR